MYAQQRGFLVDAKRYATRKAASESARDICNIKIKMSHVNSISDKIKDRIAEELSAQGFIQVEKRKNQTIKSFTFTERGLEALEEGLRTAGTVNTLSLNLDINPEFLNGLNKLVDAIKTMNLENRDNLLEIAEALRDEANEKNPKKSVIALLFGALAQTTSLGSNVATIAQAAGLNIGSLQTFISSVLK